jgi:hypothetical protein
MLYIRPNDVFPPYLDRPDEKGVSAVKTIDFWAGFGDV